MENPFGKIKDQTEVRSVNPFGRIPSETEVLSGEDPLMKGLDQNREEQAAQELPPTNRQAEGVRSYEDLYGATQEKYSDIPPGVHPFDKYQMSDKQQMDQAAREQEMLDIYNRTGREKTVMGVPVRVQTERKNNPNFDPSLPEDPETNPAYVDKEYLVDKPDSNAVKRVAIQIFENIAGGTADFVREGKLLTEGEVGKALPDVVPNDPGEQLTSELTTFIIGPAVLTKGLKVGAKATSAMSGLAGQVAKSMSPEGVAAIKNTYDTVLKSTGSAAKAFAASNGLAKRLVVGMAIGLEEGIVAPDGSEGMLVSPETIQRTFNVSPERAKDISFMLDTPVIGETLNALGGIYQFASERLVKKTFGGLRNLGSSDTIISPLARGISTNRFTINKQDAGLRVITWLDPNLTNTAPEEFAYRVNLLAGALERKATKNVQLAGASAEVNMDTPSAFMEIAKDYYDLSYGHLKEVMGTKEFNEWVSAQASETANRLFELRTAIVDDAGLATQTAKTSSSLESLFNEASGNNATGALADAQGQTGQILGDTHIGRLDTAEGMVNDAKARKEASAEAAGNALSNNPEVQKLFEEAAGDLGSSSAIDARLKESVTEPMYRSWKKLKTETDASYQKVADSGAQGDANSILEIIGEDGMQDPVLSKIAESVNSDDSFKNIYNNVRKTVSREIDTITKSGNDPMNRLDKLKELRDNITGTEGNTQLNFLLENGDNDVVDAVNSAKENFIKLQTSWRDEESLKNLTDRYGRPRLRGENLPAGVGPGQGVTNWDINAVRTVQNGLDGSTGELFRQSLDRAATAGGEDVSKGIAEYYTSKSLNNLANRVASGDKQSVGTLRQSIKSYVNILDNMNSPLVAKYKKLEVDLQTLENAANADKKMFDKVLEEAEKIKSDAQQSVLAKFVSGRENLGASDVDRRMKQIFGSADSEAQLGKLMTEANQLGDEGQIVKEALQGTYLDYLKGKIFTNRPIAVSDIKDGMITQGYKINEVNARKMFEPNSKEMSNLRLLFSDNPEVFDQVKDVVTTLQNITKTTSKDSTILKQSIDKGSDPVQGTNSLIQFTLGVLNPTATRAKRIVGPLAAENLEQVKQAQSAIMIAMITDPKTFADISRRIATNVEDKAAKAQFKALVARGAARTWATDVNDDMDNLE